MYIGTGEFVASSKVFCPSQNAIKYERSDY